MSRGEKGCEGRNHEPSKELTLTLPEGERLAELDVALAAALKRVRQVRAAGWYGEQEDQDTLRRLALEVELGAVAAAVRLLEVAEDLDGSTILRHEGHELRRAARQMEYQEAQLFSRALVGRP